jgi:hypothetical protein
MRFAAVVLLALQVMPPAPVLERLPFAPRRGICYRATAPLVIDGRLDEASWRAAAWSEAFVDIEGDARPRPSLATRLKMLWDDRYLYVAAEMEEPDLWATLTTRDSVIYQDNDFELFIDPDGDTHEYYELEINALNTVWDLMLIRPYRDGGPAINAWDIAGLKTAVHTRGTLNRPGDVDQGWTVEIAMPWTVLRQAAPEARAPRDGEQWRMNFSRVQWQRDAKGGRYVKRTDANGVALPENNWVWSPQGAVAMHMPERWGYVQFSDIAVTEVSATHVAATHVAQPFRAAAGAADSKAATFVENPDEAIKWGLRRLYYRQADYRIAHDRYARSLTELGGPHVGVQGIALHATDDLYVVTAPSAAGGLITLRQDGKVWHTDSKK